MALRYNLEPATVLLPPDAHVVYSVFIIVTPTLASPAPVADPALVASSGLVAFPAELSPD